jgi:hypothetical protein
VLEGREGRLGGVIVVKDAEARGPGRRGELVAQAEPFAGLDADVAGGHGVRDDRQDLGLGAFGPLAALAERVEAEIRSRDLTGGPSFMAALAYLSIMPSARAAGALEARAAALTGEAQRLQETTDATDAPEVHMIEVHYLLARLRHDREWLTATAACIRAGELTWPGSAPAG